MDNPPLDIAFIQFITALPAPGVAETPVGGEGTEVYKKGAEIPGIKDDPFVLFTYIVKI